MLNDNITWLLISNASKGKLFSLRKARFIQNPHPENLTLIETFTHKESRQKTADLVSDKLGEFGEGTFVEPTSPKKHEAEEFALELVKHLESARKDNCYRDVILVAPPSFMGLLYKHMSQQMQKAINQRIEKDYTSHEDNELVKSLINHF